MNRKWNTLQVVQKKKKKMQSVIILTSSLLQNVRKLSLRLFFLFNHLRAPYFMIKDCK